MSDCLVTKLKGVVDNDNLEKLGVLKINRVYNANETQNSAYLGVVRSEIPAGKTVVLKIIGDGYFADTYGGASIGKEVEVSSEQSTAVRNLYTSNGNYEIEIHNKYDFRVNQLSKDYHTKIDDVFWTKIIGINGEGYYGSLGSLDANKITSVNLADSQYGAVTYTNEDIAKLINITSFSVASERFERIDTNTLGKLINLVGANQVSVLQGSIEDFVAEQRAGGRTTFSETLNLKWIGALGLVTFNGATISNVQDGYITWTASTITFRGTTIDA